MYRSIKGWSDNKIKIVQSLYFRWKLILIFIVYFGMHCFKIKYLFEWLWLLINIENQGFFKSFTSNKVYLIDEVILDFARKGAYLKIGFDTYGSSYYLAKWFDLRHFYILLGRSKVYLGSITKKVIFYDTYSKTVM